MGRARVRAGGLLGSVQPGRPRVAGGVRGRGTGLRRPGPQRRCASGRGERARNSNSLDGQRQRLRRWHFRTRRPRTRLRRRAVGLVATPRRTAGRRRLWTRDTGSSSIGRHRARPAWPGWRGTRRRRPRGRVGEGVRRGVLRNHRGRSECGWPPTATGFRAVALQAPTAATKDRRGPTAAWDVGRDTGRQAPQTTPRPHPVGSRARRRSGPTGAKVADRKGARRHGEFLV